METSNLSDKFEPIIAEILRREDATGRGVVTDDPNDLGGLTQWGLSKKAHPAEWADGVVTQDEARNAYLKKYVEGPGFDKIPDTHAKLRTQLIDFGVHSGPAVAIQKVQAILGLKVDGQFGPKTLDAVQAADPLKLNNQLVAERVKMISRLVQKQPNQVKWLAGWMNRCLEFLG